jgi:hypothetical protein
MSRLFYIWLVLLLYKRQRIALERNKIKKRSYGMLVFICPLKPCENIPEFRAVKYAMFKRS